MIASTFILASAAILLTPGPTNTLLAASGAVMGLRRALVLPLAESLGYAVAVSGFVWLACAVAGIHWAMPALKAVAAVWLLYSAIRLWSAKVAVAPEPGRRAFLRVLLTTLLNPKAMLVGTLMIPQLPPLQAAPFVGGYVAMAYLAGLCWVMLGANLPRGFRPYAYKAAALVLTLFSLIAAGGAVTAA